MKKLAWFAVAISLAACGDNIKDDNPMVDSGPRDAPPDTGTVFEVPTPMAVALSTAGPDQLMSATAGPNGTFYAAGFSAPSAAGVPTIALAKLTATGALDTSWGGGDGFVTTDVEFAGAADEIDVTTLADGKIVVSATVPAVTTNPVDADDSDVAVLRFDATGALDTTFGGGDGIATFNLNTSVLTTGGTPMPTARDAVRGLAVDSSGRIYLHGLQRNERGGVPAATDTDMVVVRILANGSALDTTFSADGKYLLDIAGATETTRGIHVFSDGSVLANGYTRSTVVNTTGPQAVLYKLTSAGALDTNFAEQGIFHDTVLQVQTEIYNVAVHGANIVTAGYGRDAGEQNDLVSLRFNASTGARDTTWGGAANGAVVIDVSGTMTAENLRNIAGLPGGKSMIVGSTGSGNPAQDAAIVILDEDGTLDEDYGDGIHTFALGANGVDQFWGVAVSGDNALAVGWSSPGSTQTEAANDNSFALLLPLE